MLLDCFVACDPAPQPRPRLRLFRRKDTGKLGAVPFTDPGSPVHPFRAAVRMQAAFARPRGWPLDAGYRLLLVVYRRPPKGLPKRDRRPGVLNSTKPDADNYLKAVKDALKGLAWADDGQVTDARVLKVYAGPGEPVGVRLLLRACRPHAAVDVGGVVGEWKAQTLAEGLGYEKSVGAPGGRVAVRAAEHRPGPGAANAPDAGSGLPPEAGSRAGPETGL